MCVADEIKRASNEAASLRVGEHEQNVAAELRWRLHKVATHRVKTVNVCLPV